MSRAAHLLPSCYNQEERLPISPFRDLPRRPRGFLF
jgi:hypothetical protein